MMPRPSSFRPATCVLLLAILAACEPTPQTYDFHGPPADISSLDNRHVSEIGPLDLTDLRFSETGLAEAEPETADIKPLEISSDLQVPGTGPRSCTWPLKFAPPDGSTVAIAGEFTDWADNEIPLVDNDGDGTYELELELAELAPGSYAYKFRTQADNWSLDPNNPLAKWVEGIENSKLVVPDCRLPQLLLADWEALPDQGTITATVDVLDGAGSAGVFPATAALFVNGEQQPASSFDPEQGRFFVTLNGLTKGTKVSLRFAIANEFGVAENLYLPIWLDDDWQWRDAALYFAFTDRFANGTPENDAPAPCTEADSLTNWQGGDFAGITQKIEQGYFDELGINVIWISPVIDNPDGCMGGTIPGITYTAYHGYFPVLIEDTEARFGALAELKQLIRVAHDRGIRVIVDFVANHVHEESPLWTEHQAGGWFHDFNSCEPTWSKPIECWFQPYLPDLDYTNDQVVETLTDNAVFWILETDIDGFRVDAVKHMVHNFMRSLRWKIEQKVITTAAPFFMVGETFMGEWGGGTGEAETVIKEYVNDWELNGQFDFPFYWKILKATGRDEGDFQELAEFLNDSQGYYGQDALMVSFIGNHDVPRFTSHAAGHIDDLWGNGSKEQGLYSPPDQPDEADPYRRTSLAIGLMFALPEIPLLYYGDEIGLVGAGDPDNRRNMLFEGLPERQKEVLEFTRKLGSLRLKLAPLRRGDFQVVLAQPDLLLFTRTYQGQTVAVAANRSADAAQVAAAVPGLSGELLEHISGNPVAAGDELKLELPPFGLAVVAAP